MNCNNEYLFNNTHVQTKEGIKKEQVHNEI